MRKAREDIGIALLANSGIFVPLAINVVQYIAIVELHHAMTCIYSCM